MQSRLYSMLLLYPDPYLRFAAAGAVSRLLKNAGLFGRCIQFFKNVVQALFHGFVRRIPFGYQVKFTGRSL